MFEKIKREITYIKGNQYGLKTTITIDGKEYCESELCADNEYTIYPEPLEDQLQKLIPDVDINLITEFLSYVENTNTSEGFDNVQKMWSNLVNTQKDNSNVNKLNELRRIITETRDTIFKKGWDTCKGYTTKDNCEKCPFNNDRECRLSSALAALKSLQDACAVKGMKK